MQFLTHALSDFLPQASETACRLLTTTDLAEFLLHGSPALRTATSLCLHSEVPMLLLWGNDPRCIYNDAVAALLGHAHPQAFGRTLATQTAPILRELHAAVEAMPMDAQAPRSRLWSCTPLVELGTLLGHLCIARDTASAFSSAGSSTGLSLPTNSTPLASAFDRSPAFLAVLRGSNYRIEQVNARFRELFGTRELLDRPLAEAVPEIAPQGHQQLLDRVRESGQPFFSETTITYLQHAPESAPEKICIDLLYQPIHGTNGQIESILMQGYDITQQRRWENRDSFLLGLEDTLQNLSEPQEIIDTSVRLLGQHLQVNRCAYALVDEDTNTIRIASDYVYNMDNLHGEFQIGEINEGLREALQANRPWLIHDSDSADSPNYLCQHYRRSGLRASLVIPLHKYGRPVATIGAHQRSPRRWLPTEIELVRLVGTRCWESVQRAKVQRQLTASQARLSRLADSIPQIIFITDQDGNAQYFNRRWYEYTGLDSQTDAQAAWRQVHTHDGLRLSSQAWSVAVAKGHTYEIECELRRHDGQWRWQLARGLPLLEEDGQIKQWIGSYTDIHDRRSFEQKLRESQRRFRTLCETVPAMIWMTDKDGNCIYLNARWFEFTGLNAENSLAQGWWDALHPDDMARVRHTFEQALDRHDLFVAEYRMRRHDGQYRWFMDNASPRLDAEGNFLGHIGSLVNISERKQIEDVTASERSILSLITTGAPLAVVLDAIALSVEARSETPLYCSILVADPEQQVLSFGAGPHLPGDYASHFDGILINQDGSPCARAAYTGRQVTCEDIANDPDWSNYRSVALALGIAACCVTPILGDNGRVLGTLTMYYPSTYLSSLREQAMARSASHLAGIVIERTRVDAKLQLSLAAETTARNQAEQANRIKDEFLATLSHELRTPLNAILGWARLMQSENFEQKNFAKGLTIIERSASAQSQIIDDLLNMTAILSGKVRLQPEPFDLAALARSTVELMQPAALAKQIDLKLVPLTPGAIPFHGDAGRLQQVLTNLLGNALKFTPEGGQVRLEVQQEPHQLSLRVQDTGVGISADFLPHVFDRFCQADAGTTRRVGGLGLGLSISHQLIELHGGKLEAASMGVGKGATFTIVLPRTQAIREQTATDEPLTNVRQTTNEQQLHGIRILVVDDDADSREAVLHFLRMTGAQADGASSVDEAERRLTSDPHFDVLISDIAMPIRDGYDLIRTLRVGQPGLPRHILAIALTAYVRDEDKDQALLAGFDAHMGKPIEPPKLVQLIERLVLRSCATTTA